MSATGASEHPRLPRPLLRGARGAVACGHPLAASAAAAVLAEGGSAADAAVAGGFALCVLLPGACGLGGDVMALVHADGGAQTAYVGSGRSPAGLSEPIAAEGGGSVAVPGAVAALADLHAERGRMPWQRLLAPAIQLAHEGMPLGEQLHESLLASRARLSRAAGGWSLLRDAAPVGALVRQPPLAEALRRIAEEGRDALYRGELAAAIARAVQADGGRLAESDLAEHETLCAEPIARSRLGARLTVHPPASQALLLLTALGAFEAAGARPGAERVHALAEALAGSFVYRDEIAGQDAARLADAEVQIDLARAIQTARPEMNAHTTALAAADAGGEVVSMLLSIFHVYGSGLLVPEGGFLMNDRLHGFGTGPNRPRPYERPVHTLSPILCERDSEVLALCTPGADGQVQTLAQILVALMLDGASVPEALDAARFRCGDGRLAVEADIGAQMIAELAERGHPIDEFPPGSALFGAAACAGFDSETGTTFAASDPRAESWAAVA